MKGTEQNRTEWWKCKQKHADIELDILLFFLRILRSHRRTLTPIHASKTTQWIFKIGIISAVSFNVINLVCNSTSDVFGRLNDSQLVILWNVSANKQKKFMCVIFIANFIAFLWGLSSSESSLVSVYSFQLTHWHSHDIAYMRFHVIVFLCDCDDGYCRA